MKREGRVSQQADDGDESGYSTKTYSSFIQSALKARPTKGNIEYVYLTWHSQVTIPLISTFNSQF